MTRARRLPLVAVLPYPPTINSYWKRAGQAVRISNEGIRFRSSVRDYFNEHPCETFQGSLAVSISLVPPDRRKRDVDNIQKPLLDALEIAGVYEDDSQIDDLRTQRFEPKRDGFVVVTIKEI